MCCAGSPPRSRPPSATSSPEPDLAARPPPATGPAPPLLHPRPRPPSAPPPPAPPTAGPVFPPKLVDGVHQLVLGSGHDKASRRGGPGRGPVHGQRVHHPGDQAAAQGQ